MRKSIIDFTKYVARGVDGTAVENIVVNNENHRKGYLKITGCMVGIEDEDLNEYTAIRILKDLGLNAADIDLVIDDSKNAWVSYDLLDETEEAVELGFGELPLSYEELKMESPEKLFLLYIKNMEESTSIFKEKSHEMFVELLKSLLMDSILENHDFKSDNKKFAVDKKTGIPNSLMYYDYGVAFNKNSIQKHNIFISQESKTIIFYLFKYYYDELKEFIHDVSNKITPEYLVNMLSDSVYTTKTKVLYYETIMNNMNYVNNLINKYEEEISYENSNRYR